MLIRAPAGDRLFTDATPMYRQNRQNCPAARFRRFCRCRRQMSQDKRLRARPPGLMLFPGWARGPPGHSPRAPSAEKVRGSDMAAPRGASVVPETPGLRWSPSTALPSSAGGTSTPSVGAPPPRSLPRSMKWSDSWTRWGSRLRRSSDGRGPTNGISALESVRGAGNAASSMSTQPSDVHDVDRHPVLPGCTPGATAVCWAAVIVQLWLLTVAGSLNWTVSLRSCWRRRSSMTTSSPWSGRRKRS